jgi:hypothetical protein
MIEIRLHVGYELEDDVEDGSEVAAVKPVVLEEIRKMIVSISTRVEEMGIDATIRDYEEGR